MQHGRAALLADPLGRLAGGVVGGGQVAAVGGEVAQARAGAQRLGCPAVGRRDADAVAVVLADQQQRQPLAGVVVPAGGVEGRGRGRVVDRGVAEGGHRERVGRPGGLRAAGDAEGQADGPGQVRGDRGSGRDDLQVGTAEDLVPAAGDRLGGGGHHPAQHVPRGLDQRILAGLVVAVGAGLLGPGTVEPAGPVVQQRRVVRAQGGGHRRVSLVAGRADRVEALVEAAQPARRQVEMSAGELGVEELPGADPGEGRAVAYGFVGRRPTVARLQGRDGVTEALVEVLRGGHATQHCRPSPPPPPRTSAVGHSTGSPLATDARAV